MNKVFDLKELSGEICPYCKRDTEYVDSSVIYGKSYGMIYICKPCKAYCGVYKETNKSLGRLANFDLRNHKKEAHRYFDSIWKSDIMSRTELYQKLSKYLDIPEEYCHIGMFDIDTCKEVVVFSKEILKDIEE
jgi:zinc-finger-containing domain